MISSGSQIGVELRRVAGQAMEVGERDGALAGRPRDMDLGLERGERDAHVGRVRGDAGSLVPRIAWMRLKPSMAEQPLPGSRLLQGVAVS